MKEKLIKKLSEIEGIATKYTDVIKTEAEDRRTECGIVSIEELQSELKKIFEKDRLLNIGIIGKVKAGKSSLLNSVFFEGESVLPKAATPMTASLTILTYGDQFSATVEFYSAKDIEQIRKEHDEYKEELKVIYDQKRQEVEDRAKKKGEKPDMNKAERQAKKEKENSPKLSSFDQYKKMKESGKLMEMISCEKNATRENIIAKNSEALMNELSKYVGSKGELMPFTKSVEIHLPIEDLKDIQVVDTPGINDPVKSREERTIEYLRKCDVVFIVSSAGQFLTSEDTSLMDNLQSKQGVRELYLVASQADNQLYGSEKDEANGDFRTVIQNIRSQLSKHANETLIALKKSNPETSAQFGQLIEDGENRIMITSAMSHALRLRFNDKDHWDEGMKHVWGLLRNNYPDNFDTDIIAKTSLDSLHGIDDVRNKIAFARREKDKIIEKKQTKYLAQQEANIKNFNIELQKSVNDKIRRVDSTDIKKLEDDKKKNEELYARGKEAIDGTFDDCVEELKIALLGTILKNSESLFLGAQDGVSDSEQTITEIRTRKKDGVLPWFARIIGFGGFESYNVDINTIRSGGVKSLLGNLIYELEQNIIKSVSEKIKSWKKEVQKDITHKLREAVKDDSLIDTIRLTTCLRRVFNNIKTQDFSLKSHAFNSNYSGILRGDEAEKFIEDVNAYIIKLRQIYTNQSNNFISELEKTLKREKMSELMFVDLRKQLETLEKDISTKKLTLDRLHKCLNELKNNV
ncbi:MAG: dynamin family protein [Fusobacteriaceae bacterium]|jgi:predicted GTPase|nr:dynamin family protein [Fusobacteriaceae bacterium]